MDNEQQSDTHQHKIIHSGLTFFPTCRHIYTFLLLCLLEAHGIYICMPLNNNSNLTFFISQILLLIIIIYSWFMVLSVSPGPLTRVFNDQFVKSTIKKAHQAQSQTTKNTICTKCIMESISKLYHCEHCNRCVYKYFFHSRWLNTCIAKQNFPQFTAFLIFLGVYLILLQINNVIFYLQLRNLSQDTFIDFFASNFINALVSFFLLISSFLVLAVMSMIAGSFFMVRRVKGSVLPNNTCKQGCQGLKKSSHDKILIKLREQVRQSNSLASNRQQCISESSNRYIFRESDDFITKYLDVKSFKKLQLPHSGLQSRQKQSQSLCSIADFHGPYFKTDFFESAKIFQKKQSSIVRKKKKSRMETLQQEIYKITENKWRKYMQQTTHQEGELNRNSDLQLAADIKKNQITNPTNVLVKKQKVQDKNHQESLEKSADSSSKMQHSSFIQSNIGKKKPFSKFYQNELYDNKENSPSPKSKKPKHGKKNLQRKLAQINEKQEKMQGI